MANALDILTRNQDGTFSPKLDKGQRQLFVGRSGSGKSSAEISFVELGPMYCFDCDNRFRGTGPALNWLGYEKFSKIDFDFYNPDDGFIAIDKKLNAIANTAEKGQCKYKTISIDSVGSLATMLALDSQRLRGQSDKKGKVRGKVTFLHPDDYNYVSTAFRILMFNYIFPLNEMGINFMMSGWVADKWGKKAGANEFDPPEVIGERILASGNFVEEVMGYFDETYYFRKQPPVLQNQMPKYTVEFNGSFAKTAFGLPAGQHEVTGKSFYNMWKESVEKCFFGTANGKEVIVNAG